MLVLLCFALDGLSFKTLCMTELSLPHSAVQWLEESHQLGYIRSFLERVVRLPSVPPQSGQSWSLTLALPCNMLA